MSARNRRRLCAYCGKAKKLTADHVPPKLFLEQPFPANLMTVPACGDCNQGFKADDEYTRTVLAVDIRANWNHAAQFNLPAILRSLQRPDARGFAEMARTVSSMPDHRDGSVGTAFSYFVAFSGRVSVWLTLLYDYFFWVGTVDEREPSGGGPAATVAP